MGGDEMVSEFGDYFDVSAMRIMADFVLWLRLGQRVIMDETHV